MQYTFRTIERAERAARCLPFRLDLFEAMRQQGVPLKAVVGEQGVRKRYTKTPLAELAAEDDLSWLIRVGVLRREVDGQGITDAFRLTPLGHRLVEKWQCTGKIEAPTLPQRLLDLLNRWLS
ncbi:Npun_F0494 family protein [Leptolyngbya sp. FACHB-261]|uniref:Npun_F0494 family protein n=1 Tax=Leptolyngbya sp. FACHB-261 TaxID=2692806 RepID=UPI001689D116|nr:Npun_F0494 family protein [Leptolyngbya sp. FACHB-261]MBD2099899.1 hypothetical protein [Leptolyngbya sp. FACHB-261]